MPEEISKWLEELKIEDFETWSMWHGLLERYPNIDAESPHSLYYLQGEIQNAIAARGWDWYVEERANPGELLPCMALVECNPAWQCDGHTPAEALLSAYIQALKAISCV